VGHGSVGARGRRRVAGSVRSGRPGGLWRVGHASRVGMRRSRAMPIVRTARGRPMGLCPVGHGPVGARRERRIARSVRAGPPGGLWRVGHASGVTMPQRPAVAIVRAARGQLKVFWRAGLGPMAARRQRMVAVTGRAMAGPPRVLRPVGRARVVARRQRKVAVTGRARVALLRVLWAGGRDRVPMGRIWAGCLSWSCLGAAVRRRRRPDQIAPPPSVTSPCRLTRPSLGPRPCRRCCRRPTGLGPPVRTVNRCWI